MAVWRARQSDLATPTYLGRRWSNPGWGIVDEELVDLTHSGGDE